LHVHPRFYSPPAHAFSAFCWLCLLGDFVGNFAFSPATPAFRDCFASTPFASKSLLSSPQSLPKCRVTLLLLTIPSHQMNFCSSPSPLFPTFYGLSNVHFPPIPTAADPPSQRRPAGYSAPVSADSAGGIRGCCENGGGRVRKKRRRRQLLYPLQRQAGLLGSEKVPKLKASSPTAFGCCAAFPFPFLLFPSFPLPSQATITRRWRRKTASSVFFSHGFCQRLRRPIARFSLR